jgi:hypothetical protein
MLDRNLRLGLLLLAAPFAFGCATLPRTSVDDVSSSDEPLLIEGTQPAAASAYVGSAGAANEEVEVAWTDNGQSIRPLSEDEGPRSVVVPKTSARKRPVLIGSASNSAPSPAKLSR